MMRKVSRARSRQTTPWDSREEISPIQHFLQMHYKAHYEARHPQLTETGEVELINSFVPSKCPICGAKDFRKRSHTSNGVQRYQCWRVVSSRYKILGNFQQSLYYYGFMRLRKRSETRSKKRWGYCV